MFLYWSTFELAGPAGSRRIRPTIASAITTGGWVAKDFRDGDNPSQVSTAGHCLVATSAAVGVLPAGVTFLLNTATDLDTAVPANVRTFLNNNLAVTVPAGLVWRELFRRLFRVLGTGRWGVMDADFGHIGAFGV